VHYSINQDGNKLSIIVDERYKNKSTVQSKK